MGIGLEITKNLKQVDSYKYIKSMDENNKLIELIPEMIPMKSVGECKYHVINCYDHSIFALEILERSLEDIEFIPSHLKEFVTRYLSEEVEVGITRLELLKLGVLFHDIGKPPSKTVDPDGRVRFRNHENIGADISLDILDRFELSKKSKDTVYLYVKYHMALLGWYKNKDLAKEILNDIFTKVDDDIIGLMLLGYADIVSTRILLNPEEDFNIIKTYMIYIMTDYIYRYKAI